VSSAEPPSLERRLSALTDIGTEILRRWAATANRHAAAVAQLERQLQELGGAGAQLQKDTEQRLSDLEKIIEHEWDALRELHEAPVRQLVEQAANLTEVCIATANSAQHGFDRAEARLAAMESTLQRTTSELTAQVQTLVNQMRTLTPASRQLAGETPAWPLEDVTRLHQQLRDTAGTDQAGPRLLSEGSAPQRPPSTFEPADTVAESTSPVVAAVPSTSRFGLPRPVLAVVLVLLVAGGGFVWRLERDMRSSAARVDESQRQLRLAADSATQEMGRRQEEASRQLAAAEQLAGRAQKISDVLAAPDLVRYSLVGRDALATAFGQMLWSRSRGYVFSASGIPAPPQDETYQMWLLTRTGAISGGTFAPDANGRVTLVDSPKIPPMMLGAMVTIEPKGGSGTPSGEPMLARATPPPEAP
jgi:anti-sigma-K factor RskA